MHDHPPLTIALPDEAATEALGRRLAAAARPGDVIALAGPLGIGKSVLARAFVRALAGAEEEVPSPTFTLVQTYDGNSGSIAHFDLYRIEQPEEALELGFEDAVAGGIVLIEWPDRLGYLLPARRLDVTLREGDGKRAAELAARGGSELLERYGA
jgi:tRNA threonylcarbamoyladenosine biosynthesis protein TsaE